MSKRNWIKAFAPLDRQRLLQTAAESVNWIEQYGHVDGDVESWDVMPGKQVEKDALLLDDASLYAGAAGIALLYLKYYVATEHGSTIFAGGLHRLFEWSGGRCLCCKGTL